MTFSSKLVINQNLQFPSTVFHSKSHSLCQPHTFVRPFCPSVRKRRLLRCFAQKDSIADDLIVGKKLVAER
jgi:hypothetical protein